MVDSDNTPILIGVGDIINRNLGADHAAEPLELMLHAITIALNDTGLSRYAISDLRAQIDSIDVVRTWTWPYPDLPGLLANKLGVKPKHSYYSPHGGNQPAKLVDEAARRISKGETKVAIVAGGEALASLAACAKAGVMPPPDWTLVPDPVSKIISPSASEFATDLGASHKIGAPIQVYPLYENGLRAHRKQSIEENNTESAKMYAQFAQIAKQNPLAWHFTKTTETEQSIGTVSKKNRMICFPYPLLMNAFNTINLAGAVILTSVSIATSLNIPRSKWIYIHGGAGTSEPANFWQRANFHSSPAISRSLDSALGLCNLSKANIDMYDFYSCFPIVPKLAARHLDLSILEPETPLTLLGGLTSFGGAGNNYSMHAISEMTKRLRKGQGKIGLILANGGVLTHQHVLILSSAPRPHGATYPAQNPLPEILDVDAPRVQEVANGDAVIETYTVDFHRNGEPRLGHVVGRTRDGKRFIANHGDTATLKQLASRTQEPIGKTGVVKSDKGRNLFFFNEGARL